MREQDMGDGTAVASPDPGEQRSFSVLMANLEDGVLNRDLTEQIAAMVERMQTIERDQGGRPKGQISLTLDFTLDSGVVEIRSGYKVRTPKEARGKSIYWAVSGGGLSTRNPRQRELPLRQVGDNDRVRTV